MKKFVISGVILCAGFVAAAQQRPHYTQYVINPFLVNPAIAGIENYTDLKMGVRDQWVGLNGAPKTTYFTIHSPLGKKDDYSTSATSFEVPGENPRGQAYWRPKFAYAPVITKANRIPTNRAASNSTALNIACGIISSSLWWVPEVWQPWPERPPTRLRPS